MKAYYPPDEIKEMPINEINKLFYSCYKRRPRLAEVNHIREVGKLKQIANLPKEKKVEVPQEKIDNASLKTIGDSFYKLHRRKPTIKEINHAITTGELKLLLNKTFEKVTPMKTEEQIKNKKYYYEKQKEKKREIRSLFNYDVDIIYAKLSPESEKLLTLQKNKLRKEAVLKYHQDNKIVIPTIMKKVLEKY